MYIHRMMGSRLHKYSYRGSVIDEFGISKHLLIQSLQETNANIFGSLMLPSFLQKDDPRSLGLPSNPSAPRCNSTGAMIL
jgi:hypothetical protein